MSERGMLGILVSTTIGLALAPGEPARAQGVPLPGGAPPTPGPGGPELLGPLILVVVAIVGLLIVAARFHDARRRRRVEALAIETVLADILMQEPRLAGASVVAAVHLPLAAGAPPTVEVRGEVPSPELRQVAVRLVSQEVRRVYPATEIQDRIFVAPPVLSRSG